MSVPCLHCKLPLITLMACHGSAAVFGDTAAKSWSLLQCLDYPGFEASAVHFEYPLSGDTAVEISSAGPALMYPGYKSVCVCLSLRVSVCFCVACV